MKIVSFKEKLKSFGSAVAVIVLLGAMLWAAVGDFLGWHDPVTDAQREKEYQESLIYEKGYEAGFRDGREDGYEDGYDEGRSEGYDEGYELGLLHGNDEGYREGYEDGYHDGTS